MTKRKGTKKSKIKFIKENPPTIFADQIYSIEDAKIHKTFNITPLIIKGEFEEPFITIENKEYHIIKNKYAILDIYNYLRQFNIDDYVRLLLSGRELYNIHHVRKNKEDITICTNIQNFQLSYIISEIIKNQEKEKQKIR